MPLQSEYYTVNGSSYLHSQALVVGLLERFRREREFLDSFFSLLPLLAYTV
jgi:hypothetical protein